MLTLYYPPFRADDDVELLEMCLTSIRAYVEDLAEFDADTLGRAWRDVRRRHKVERWPTISDIRDACLAAQPRQPITKTSARVDKKPVDRWEFIASADAYMLTAQGQWALRHGCGLAAWEFVAERNQYPDRDELKRIAEKVASNADRAAGLDPANALSATLLKVWRTMRSKEAALAERFLQDRAA